MLIKSYKQHNSFYRTDFTDHIFSDRSIFVKDSFVERSMLNSLIISIPALAFVMFNSKT